MFGGNPPPASGFGQSGLQPSKNPYAISAASKSFSGTLATQTTNFGGPSPWNQKAGGHTAGLTPPTTTFGSGFATGFGGSGASPAPTPFAGSTGIKAADKPTESLPYQASIFGNDAKTNANSNTGHLFGSSSFAGSQPRAFGGQSFKCRVCQSAFQSSDELRKHIKSENHFDPSRPANQGSAQPSGFGPQAGSKPTFGSQSDVAYNPTAGNKLQGFAEPSAARDEKPPYPPSTYTGVAPVQQGQGLGQGHGQMQSMNQDQNQHGFAPRAPRGAPTGNYQSNYASSGVPIINGPGGARAPWHRSGAAPSQDARQQHSQHPATAAGGGARQPPRGSLNAHPAVAGNALTGTGVSYGEAGRATSGQPPRTAAPYNTPFTPQRSAHNLAAPSAPGGPRTSSAGGANSAAHAGMGGVGGFRPTSHGTAPLSHSAHLLSSARGPPKAATTSQPVHSIQEKEEDDNPDSDDANLGVTHGGRRDNGDHASDADYVPDSADEDDSGDEEDDLNFSFSSQESGGGGGGSNGTVTRSGGSGSNSGGSSSSSSSSCAAGIAGATSGHAGAGVPPFRAAAGGGAPPQQTHQQQQQKPSLGAGVARAPGKNVSSNQLSSGDSASENESMASSADSSDVRMNFVCLKLFHFSYNLIG